MKEHQSDSESMSGGMKENDSGFGNQKLKLDLHFSNSNLLKILNGDESEDASDDRSVISNSTSQKKSRKDLRAGDEYEIDLSNGIEDPNIISTSTKPKKIQKQKESAEPKPEEPVISTYDYNNDPDMAPERPKHKGEKDRIKELKKQNINNYLTPEENPRELAAIERSKKLKEEMISNLEKTPMSDREKNLEMERIKNWDFTPKRLDQVKEKTSTGRKVLTWLAHAFGFLLHFPFFPFLYIPAFTSQVVGDVVDMQEKREHENIPGWDGKTFDTEAGGEEILADFRRVPTVWSYLTADRATEDAEGKKPRDSVITVYMDQPKDRSSDTLNGDEMGHAMLGIEYSRYSKVSDRYERYGLQYGFYPAGGTIKGGSTLSMLFLNARLPGQLKDDSGHRYSISRRYTAKPEQVNDIIKASETYADEGYGYYDRNCTTFVKEMVVDTAHLATGGEIFKNSEITFSHWANFGMLAGNLGSAGSEMSTNIKLIGLRNSEDKSYQNYGNKRMTRDEWDRYRKSLSTVDRWEINTFIPAATGERMRRLEGKEAGEIGSWKHLGEFQDEKGEFAIALGNI